MEERTAETANKLLTNQKYDVYILLVGIRHAWAVRPGEGKPRLFDKLAQSQPPRELGRGGNYFIPIGP